MGPHARTGLLLGWIVALAVLGYAVARDLRVGTDLRLFMPTPQTPAQRLLLDQVGEGPASRLLLLSIGGDEPAALARSSRALAAALRAEPAFRAVANGEPDAQAIPERLLPYRYLLSERFDAAPLDAAQLRAALRARLADLASPAASLVEPWVARDPTLEGLALAEAWAPAREPARVDDVWFDRAGERALLVAETRAAGFDPDGQRAALDRLQALFAAHRTASTQVLEVSGPGRFSVLMRERTQGEAQRLGGIASAGMLVLLLAAYRRVRTVLLGALPLASAALAGLAAVGLAFDAVHGITLAFGFTLIGVAQDYPLHLMSHQHAGIAPLANARRLWPTLATGVASTCIAYLAFLASGVVGLAQLATFTIAGLAAAGLSTRYLLPHLVEPRPRDCADSPWLARLDRALARLPRPRAAVPLLALAALAVLVLRPGPYWEHSLATLTPVPPALLARDAALRAELGAPDVRHLLVLEGATADAVLAAGERLRPALDALVANGAIDGYDLAARYLPSAATQLRRRAALPDAASLEAALAQAQAGTPFRPAAFAPFLADVASARALPPLTPALLADTPLAPRLEALLAPREGRWTGLVSLSGVHDPQALARFAADPRHQATLLDLKGAAEELVAAYRQRILACLGIAAVLLLVVVRLALGSWPRTRRVLLPMALGTLLIVAVLHGAGVALGLFHLIALVLAAGLGLDYALFFEHADDAPAEQRRTLHAVLICAASTLMVFALLALSSLPVLRAIGVTVTLGVVFNFLLALVLARPGRAAESGSGSETGSSETKSECLSRSAAAVDPEPAPRERHSDPVSAFAGLIPHAGAMCLNERVLAWDAQRIALATASHRDPANPLRRDGALHALHLCEYGAQAMAIHGGLCAQAAGTRAAPGFLVSLRDVVLHAQRIDTLPGELRIEAERLLEAAGSWQYAFRAWHHDHLLAEGRAAVIARTSPPG